MVEREAADDEISLHPAWLQLRAADGQVIYLHQASSSLRPRVLEGTSDGFLLMCLLDEASSQVRCPCLRLTRCCPRRFAVYGRVLPRILPCAGVRYVWRHAL